MEVEKLVPNSSNKGYYIGAGIGLILFGVGYYYRNELKNYIGTFCAGAQMGDQSPHLGELNTGGIGKFQQWANKKYNLGLSEDGTPSATTETAYAQYGREFLSDVTDAYTGSSRIFA